ncbi:hypothetical protein GUJ93_ZPchr0003g17081 [Zizania palustris]|uniref:Uncharacterized protein n=1 Tax=Zizania palustris TaxID=103762 RepID=A0A8J5VDI3_ZIZPA|nr:hypothetical protein GUJ93_ZPchr0003g17081 [Zizania palustris]
MLPQAICNLDSAALVILQQPKMQFLVPQTAVTMMSMMMTLTMMMMMMTTTMRG